MHSAARMARWPAPSLQLVPLLVSPVVPMYQEVNNLVVSAECNQLGWLSPSIYRPYDSGPQSAPACPPGESRPRGIATVAMGADVHDPARGRVSGPAMGTPRKHSLPTARDSNWGAGAVDPLRRLRLRTTPRGERTERRAARAAGACRRRAVGRATRPAQPSHHALAAQLQGADRFL